MKQFDISQITGNLFGVPFIAFGALTFNLVKVWLEIP